MIVGNTYTDGGVKWKVVTDKPPAGAWGGGTLPVGSIIPYMNNDTLPEGFLFCNGAAISRNEYHDLFDVIGTTYGSGDGSTTFNIPDLRNKFVEGSTTAGTSIAAGLPNIKGEMSVHSMNSSSTTTIGILNYGTGAIWRTVNADSVTAATMSSYKSVSTSLNFNAATYNSIYSDNVTTVQPPALTAKYIIAALPVIYPFDHDHEDATTTKSGFLSPSDKAYLDTLNGKFVNIVPAISYADLGYTTSTNPGIKILFQKWLEYVATNYFDDDIYHLSDSTFTHKIIVGTINTSGYYYIHGSCFCTKTNNLPTYSSFITHSYVDRGSLKIYHFGTYAGTYFYHSFTGVAE
jgi:microcystin-dependent protein